VIPSGVRIFLCVEPVDMLAPVNWRFGEDSRSILRAGHDPAAPAPRPEAQKKGPDPVRIRAFKSSRRRPTLPQGFPCSTIGPGGLNFRVRDGIGCDPSGVTAEICSCSVIRAGRTEESRRFSIRKFVLSAAIKRLIQRTSSSTK
jgi:hypothetical protein